MKVILILKKKSKLKNGSTEILDISKYESDSDSDYVSTFTFNNNKTELKSKNKK